MEHTTVSWAPNFNSNRLRSLGYLVGYRRVPRLQGIAFLYVLVCIQCHNFDLNPFTACTHDLICRYGNV